MMHANDAYMSALETEKGGGNPQEVVALLEIAADQKYADAQYALGTFYLHGKYVERNFQKALDCLRDASDQMHPGALFDLGVALEKGDIVKANYKEAFKCYMLSMLFGERLAVAEVARCFYYGIGVRKDESLGGTLNNAISRLAVEEPLK